MEKEVPNILRNSKNEEVLLFLKHRSCHGDIVEPIEAELRKYSDVTAFCLDGASFKYVFWYLDDTIFAFAQGMSRVSLRLPKPKSKSDKIKGEFEGLFDNEAWWSYKYNYSDLNVWVNSAYLYAKKT